MKKSRIAIWAVGIAAALAAVAFAPLVWHTIAADAQTHTRLATSLEQQSVLSASLRAVAPSEPVLVTHVLRACNEPPGQKDCFGPGGLAGYAPSAAFREAIVALNRQTEPPHAHPSGTTYCLLGSNGCAFAPDEWGFGYILASWTMVNMDAAVIVVLVPSEGIGSMEYLVMLRKHRGDWRVAYVEGRPA